MRRQNVISVLILAMVVLGLVKRHHLRQAAHTIRTYAWFDIYLRQHPETLYPYDPSDNAHIPANRSVESIPRIMHRIFLQEGRKDSSESTGAHRRAQSNHSTRKSCRILHPDWAYWIWTDSNASSFMRKHYPALWMHYRNYRQTIQRANILRYALLHFYGGVYLDWDINCLQPLDELRSLPWLTPGAHPVGVNNAFILSKPRHPFLADLLASVEESDVSWGLPYVDNMLSSGCMFFSNTWMGYTRSHKNDTLFVLADGNGRLEPHMLRGAVTTPLFRHGGASSWHEWDAKVIVLVGQYYRPCRFFLGLGIVAALLIGGRRLHRCLRGRAVGWPPRSPRFDMDEERMLLES